MIIGKKNEAFVLEEINWSIYIREQDLVKPSLFIIYKGKQSIYMKWAKKTKTYIFLIQNYHIIDRESQKWILPDSELNIAGFVSTEGVIFIENGIPECWTAFIFQRFNGFEDH